MKSMIIEIEPETLASIKMPRDTLKEELVKELGIILYEKGALSFGKARQFAKLDRWEFARELKKRGIPRHYSEKEYQEDLEFAKESHR